MSDRSLENLTAYAQGLAKRAGNEIRRGSLLAKVLTSNDDSGRHGVLIPIEGYEHFPHIEVLDSHLNATARFDSVDCIDGLSKEVAYKYYQRYPERRITCLNGKFNDRSHGLRLGLFIRAEHTDGTVGYYMDVVLEQLDDDFARICSLSFGDEIALAEGIFVLLEIDSGVFATDDALDDLLCRFDEIRERGWIDALRPGTTGIGYTFETLVGVRENNDRRADFRGIEIKCSSVRDLGDTGGKINLFQQAPRWSNQMTSLQRLRIIGQEDADGHYKCHSQVTTNPNNLGLLLRESSNSQQIDLLKQESEIGDWSFSMLEARLQEKHARAVFVKAEVRQAAGRQRFNYQEVIYCERPSIERFIQLVRSRRIVFEFLMSEEELGRVRNHGYPWRLLSAANLSDLFSLRVKVR
jgi:hypothetical protein